MKTAVISHQQVMLCLQKNEAVEALVSLGYSSSEALKTVNSIDNIEEKNSETILKEALKKLALF